MKITEHQLRRVIRKSLNEAGRPTIGAVLDAIEATQGAETAAAKKAKLKAIAKKVGWEAVKFIPVLAGLPAVGSIISNAKKAGDVYKLAKKTPDENVAKDDAVLDLLDIDDQYQLMLDDALEAKFDEEAIEKLNSMPRDALLPDMTAELEKWVKDEYNRGIEGAVTENRVRITERQLRRIIREVTMEDIFGKKVKSLDDVETVGDLKKLIKYAQSAKRAEKGKEAGEEWAKSTLWDETFGKIPGLSAAKNAADALKSMYDLPDEARTGTALDHMDVDDDVAKIVDDPIENDFLKALGDEIDGMNDDLPLSNLNVTQGLANYMGKKFNARTVAGFTEARRVRITEHQLRRIIREQLTETIEKLANGKFRLYSKKKDPKTGERKNLGTYDSREAAEEREQQVNYFKHKD